MTKGHTPLSVMKLNINPPEIKFGNSILPFICSGEATLFNELYRDQYNLFISGRLGNTIEIYGKEGHVAALIVMMDVSDNSFGVVRFSGQTCVCLFKITSSHTLLLVSIEESIDFERNCLELLIQGKYEDVFSRVANW